MKKFKSLLCISLLIITALSVIGCGKEESKSGDTTTESAEDVANIEAIDYSNDGTLNVVTSFYPMQVIAMNIADGMDNVEVTSMSAPDLGCIHDHTFSTDDLKKIEGADVFIENGYSLETFNDMIKEAYPNLPIIEASTNIIAEDANPHVWTNIDYYISQIQYVSSQLQVLDPANKDAYAANEGAYIQKIEQGLKTEYSEEIASAEGKKALVLDESVPELLKYLKMDYIEIETHHEEEALSADDLKEAIDTMNKDNIKNIIVSKTGDRSAALAIAEETGAKIYELNSCMYGLEEPTANAYLADMKENLYIISTME